MRWVLAMLATAALAGCLPAAAPTTDRLDCDGCHDDLFATAPNHVANNYPRTCYECHGLTDWKEADAAHTRFPINRDPHAGYDCEDCHLDTTDRTAITCIDCHAHTQDRTDPHHGGVGGYVYDSQACATCHKGT